MASHISTNWPLKEALFKLLNGSSQNALICIFSRVYQFWNKNRVLNYSMNYERPFCVGTCGYVGERDRKTTHKLSSQETEKAGGRTEVKKSRASTWPQGSSRDMLTVWPSRAFLQRSDVSSSKCCCHGCPTFTTPSDRKWEKEPWAQDV